MLTHIRIPKGHKQIRSQCDYHLLHWSCANWKLHLQPFSYTEPHTLFQTQQQDIGVHCCRAKTFIRVLGVGGPACRLHCLWKHTVGALHTWEVTPLMLIKHCLLTVAKPRLVSSPMTRANNYLQYMYTVHINSVHINFNLQSVTLSHFLFSTIVTFTLNTLKS